MCNFNCENGPLYESACISFIDSGLFAYKTEDTEELKRMYGSEILSDPVDNAVEG